MPQKLCSVDVFWVLHPEDNPLKQALALSSFFLFDLFSSNPHDLLISILMLPLMLCPKAQVALYYPF